MSLMIKMKYCSWDLGLNYLCELIRSLVVFSIFLVFIITEIFWISIDSPSAIASHVSFFLIFRFSAETSRFVSPSAIVWIIVRFLFMFSTYFFWFSVGAAPASVASVLNRTFLRLFLISLCRTLFRFYLISFYWFPLRSVEFSSEFHNITSWRCVLSSIFFVLVTLFVVSMFLVILSLIVVIFC